MPKKIALWTLMMMSQVGWGVNKPSFNLIDHCDIPATTIKSIAAKGVEDCQNICAANMKCKAATFISGWGRCMLKSSVSPRFEITFYSGVVRAGIIGLSQLQISKLKEGNLKDVDLPGSDIKKVGKIKSAAACRQSCSDEASCHAFTYIDGYATCWHKGTKLRMVNKIFSCAIKGGS